VQEFSPFGLDPDLFEQSSNGLDSNFRPVVSLGQVALPFGTCHDADTPGAAFEGAEEVLGIGFP
jgi:hypothetical protein